MALSFDVRSAKNVTDLSEASKKLNDNFSKGQKEIKTWQDEVAKLQEKTKQLTDTEKLAILRSPKLDLNCKQHKKQQRKLLLLKLNLHRRIKT